jgi:hypothetical protein
MREMLLATILNPPRSVGINLGECESVRIGGVFIRIVILPYDKRSNSFLGQNDQLN